MLSWGQIPEKLELMHLSMSKVLALANVFVLSVFVLVDG